MLLWKVKAFIIARIYTKHWFQNIVHPKVAHTIQSGSWPWDIRPEWRKRKPWIPKRWCLDSAPFTPFSLPTTNTSVESTGLSAASEALSAQLESLLPERSFSNRDLVCRSLLLGKHGVTYPLGPLQSVPVKLALIPTFMPRPTPLFLKTFKSFRVSALGSHLLQPALHAQRGLIHQCDHTCRTSFLPAW